MTEHVKRYLLSYIMASEDAKCKQTGKPLADAHGLVTARRIYTGTYAVKEGLAQMLKGGIIMDVVNAEQARIAEEAGACAVMALEKVPADIRRDGGVARMADPKARLLVFMEHWWAIYQGNTHPFCWPYADSQVHHGGRDDPCHGKVQNRTLCRGTNP